MFKQFLGAWENRASKFKQIFATINTSTWEILGIGAFSVKRMYKTLYISNIIVTNSLLTSILHTSTISSVTRLIDIENIAEHEIISYNQRHYTILIFGKRVMWRISVWYVFSCAFLYFQPANVKKKNGSFQRRPCQESKPSRMRHKSFFLRQSISGFMLGCVFVFICLSEFYMSKFMIFKWKNEEIDR